MTDKRPITRADCADVPRPCPYVGCRHNMFLDVGQNGRGSSIHYLWGTDDPTKMPPNLSCCLDIVDARGTQTLDQIGKIWNITRERIRQIEAKGLRKIMRKRGVDTLWELLSDAKPSSEIKERFDRIDKLRLMKDRRGQARQRGNKCTQTE